MMMGNYINTWLLASLDLFRLMAPYLLLGFFLAGVLHVLVPKEWVARHLGGRGFRASLKAAFVGTPLPLCSCGVIPFADLLKKQGASRSAITSFLISTPQTGVDSILAAYAMLGLPLALWKVLTALVSGVIGGTLVPWLDKSDRKEANCRMNGPCRTQPEQSTTAQSPVQCASDSPADSCCAKPASKTPIDSVRSIFSYGLGTLVNDIALWLVVGTLAGGAITAFVPDHLLTSTIANEYLQMLLVLVLAVPLYVCATGSIPVAVALIIKGMPIGAAIVFLVAGPATNVATLMVFTKVLGRRTVAIYLGTIIVMSLLFGIMFNHIFPNAAIPHQQVGHTHDHGGEAVFWWHWASAILLGLLVARHLLGRLIGSGLQKREGTAQDDVTSSQETITMRVDGMSCGHCQNKITKALLAIDEVREAKVSLESSQAEVTGCNLTEEDLIEAIDRAGFTARVTSFNE